MVEISHSLIICWLFVSAVALPLQSDLEDEGKLFLLCLTKNKKFQTKKCIQF